MTERAKKAAELISTWDAEEAMLYPEDVAIRNAGEALAAALKEAVDDLDDAEEKLASAAWEIRVWREDAGRRGILPSERRYGDALRMCAAALEDALGPPVEAGGSRRVAFLKSRGEDL